MLCWTLLLSLFVSQLITWFTTPVLIIHLSDHSKFLTHSHVEETAQSSCNSFFIYSLSYFVLDDNHVWELQL